MTEKRSDTQLPQLVRPDQAPLVVTVEPLAPIAVRDTTNNSSRLGWPVALVTVTIIIAACATVISYRHVENKHTQVMAAVSADVRKAEIQAQTDAKKIEAEAEVQAKRAEVDKSLYENVSKSVIAAADAVKEWAKTASKWKPWK